jgi:uracil-DNA glycosylase family protein
MTGMETGADVERPGAASWVPSRPTVASLRAAAPDCRGCELWQDATQVVFSAGSDRARVALVGEQPGDQEDRTGIPFVGPAGKLLQKALDEVGIDRGEVYVTNAVKHFRFSQSGPGKRRIHATPDRVHVEACRPWLTAELAAVKPDVVVVLGATAGKALLGPSFRVTKERGVPFRRQTTVGETCFVATVHPSSVLRSPDRDEAYTAFRADLAVVAEELGADPGQ